MELVDKYNGTHIIICKWDGKKDTIKQLRQETKKLYDYDAFYNLRLSFEIKDKNLIAHSKRMYSGNIYKTIPFGSYIASNGDVDDPLHIYTTYAVKHDFVKPNHVEEYEIVDNQSGKHYDCLHYQGNLGNIPDDWFDDANVESISPKNHALIIKSLDNKTHTIADGDYILQSYDFDDGIIIITPQQFKDDYQIAKSVKLPKYVFVVTETTGEYSDIDTEVVNVASTYQDAENIIDKKAKKLHQQLENNDSDDIFDDDEPCYDITQINTNRRND